jgi:hypothetical protein
MATFEEKVAAGVDFAETSEGDRKPAGKKAGAKKTAITPGSHTAFESYSVEVLNRKLLKGAEYNPRILDDKAKVKLRAGLQKHGMLAPPVWNKRTGTIVGGHQRIKILDALNGTDDYTLQVAVVDLDETAEKEANLLLNNTQAQGEWDIQKLDAILKDKSLDLSGTGFDMGDVYRLFGANNRNDFEVDELAKKLRAVAEQYTGQRKDTTARDALDFYLVVVFKDDDQRAQFLTDLNCEQNRYQSGVTLMTLLNDLRAENDDLRAQLGLEPKPKPAKETDAVDILKWQKEDGTAREVKPTDSRVQ